MLITFLRPIQEDEVKWPNSILLLAGTGIPSEGINSFWSLSSGWVFRFSSLFDSFLWDLSFATFSACSRVCLPWNVVMFLLAGIHKKYSETIFHRIVKSSCDILDIPQQQLMDMFGFAFVSFVGKFGLDKFKFVFPMTWLILQLSGWNCCEHWDNFCLEIIDFQVSMATTVSCGCWDDTWETSSMVWTTCTNICVSRIPN